MKTHTNEQGQVRVALEEEDFAALVRGKEVAGPGFAIILDDIGFIRMRQLLGEAFRDYLEAEYGSRRPRGDGGK